MTETSKEYCNVNDLGSAIALWFSVVGLCV